MKKFLCSLFLLLSFNLVHAQGTRIVDLPANGSAPDAFMVPGAASSGAIVSTITVGNIRGAVSAGLATVATTGSYTDLSNKPTIPSAFNFGLPFAKTLTVSTDFQAADPSKPAIITPSYACQNATTVLAASGCTLQVRVGSSALTCSTGTVLYTQSLTVALGLLITQNSTNPVQINLPIGGHAIICPSVGTFTITAVEQTAG